MDRNPQGHESAGLHVDTHHHKLPRGLVLHRTRKTGRRQTVSNPGPANGSAKQCSHHGHSFLAYCCVSRLLGSAITTATIITMAVIVVVLIVTCSARSPGRQSVGHDHGVPCESLL